LNTFAQACAVIARLGRHARSWAPRFDAALEAQYQSELIAKTLGYWRFTLLFGTGLVLMFAIWDEYFFPADVRELFEVRLAVVLPVWAGAALLSCRSRMKNGHLIQKMIVLATWHTGTGVTAMMAFAAKPLAYYVFFPGVMLAFIYMAALSVAGLYVLGGGLALLVTYVLLTRAIGMPNEILSMSLFFLIGTYSVAVFGSFEMERYKRREFLARLHSEKLLAAVVAEKRLVDRANEAKSRFLAAASHDLRQPVQAISNFVAVLQAEQRDDTSGYLVGRIEASLRSLDNLFLALLDISRLDAAQVETTIESFALQGPLTVMQSEYAPLAASKGLRLRVLPSSAVVRSDINLIERILRNLVTNALLYTAHGRVVIGCRRRAHQLALQVWDTGTGIGEEHRELVFQEFFQLDNPERDRQKGLGLGLSIVRRLCLLLGHPLRLFSTPGKGTMFEVLLPLGEPGAMAAARPAMTAPDAGVLAGIVVLLIEDEKDVRESYVLLLERWGCYAMAAAGSDEAVECLRASLRYPDLVVADFRLRNNETGAQAIGRVRGECGVQIPAILITGDTAPERIVEAQSSGLRLFHKPLDAERLRDAIVSSL
jgi:signal transduction histidine kinase/CheY-like chemotaxis protein